MRVPRLAIGSYRGDRGRDLAAPRRSPRSRRQVTLRVVVAGLLVTVLAGGGYWLLNASLFEIARVESGPYRYSDEPDVESAFSRILGRNIWTLTRGHAVAACEDLPWVREVHLRRRLPDVVVVEFIEWQPLLAVATSGADGTHMLVADGRVLGAPAHLDIPGLPLLVGCEPVAGSDQRQRLADHDLAPLLALVEAMQDTGLETACPVDFVRRTDDGFILELQGRAGSLRVGRQDFSRRLRRYLLTREQIPDGAAVDLRFEDRITIETPEPERT